MSGRFFRRTVRNVVFRNHPYFAHLAFTHRCNLRCRFCHIQETKSAELDTAGTKRAIDVLDRLGVAVLSASGGGEPLLREDFAGIPATIRYLNDHLPPGMQLTKVWLNPVVVGSGKLRTTTLAKVRPGHLEHGDLPTLLSARFYNRGVQEQYRCTACDWGCKAGRMFFDVKANGDLRLCQDQPSRTNRFGTGKREQGCY